MLNFLAFSENAAEIVLFNLAHCQAAQFTNITSSLGSAAPFCVKNHVSGKEHWFKFGFHLLD